MALEGNLRDFNLLEVIQLLGQQGKSGVLRIWDKGGVDTQIFLCEGKVTHATTTKKGTDLLGERLAKTGIISRTDFEEALRAQKESARYLGEILVESGMADEVAVLNALFTQIHEVIYGIFRQGEGKFQFETLPVSQFPKIAVNLSAEEVMFNILRMVDEWPEIERKVPAPYIVLKHTGTLEGQGIELPEDHDGVYRLVDGDRTVEDISELSLLGKFATLEILADLLEGGYLTVVESKRAPSEPQLRQTVESLKRQSHRAAYAWAMMVGVALLLISLLHLDIDSFFRVFKREHYVPTTLVERVKQERLEWGRRIFFLERGTYPQNPAKLVDAGILTKEDLTGKDVDVRGEDSNP